MDLSALNELGLPGWVIIFAALLWILRSVGLLDAAKQSATSWQDRREGKEKAERAARDDTREHVQEADTASITSSIRLNEYMVREWVKVADKQAQAIDALTQALKRVEGRVARIEASQEITSREWSRIEEVLGDIDLFMHETKQELSAIFLILSQKSAGNLGQSKPAADNPADKS